MAQNRSFRILALLSIGYAMTGAAQTTTATVQAAFNAPPADARPMVRWWWFGPAVTKPEIARELGQMKTDGIGGVEIAFVYPLTLDGAIPGVRNLPFVSPAMLEMVAYAQAQARELGLRVDVTLGSGWPYGGAEIPLSLAAGKLRTVEVAVAPGASSVNEPELKAGESFVAASLVQGAPRAWSSAGAVGLRLGGGISFAASTTPRVALFFIASHTGQKVKRASVGAEGWVLDPFSAQAVATHLRAVGQPLVGAFGARPPYAIFSDSLEAYGADWTPSLPEEFRKRRGYDLVAKLPELLAGDTPEAKRVRHDYGETLTELIDANYLTQINTWARDHGTKFRSQTYGDPAVTLSSQRLVALPEGEGSQWRQFSTLRWATSANHVFGNNVTSGETFTWLHTPVFRATPLDMKAEADIDFLTGENQLIFHGWPYSPGAELLPKGDPGWSLYAAAALNDHNPWHPVMPAVTKYISRISGLLRQGEPANQVALLLPTDDAWASFAPAKDSVSDAMKTLITPQLMDAILAAGYNVDFVDATAIRTSGLGTHSIVILPPTDRIPAATLATLAGFASHGGKLIAVGRLPTLDAEGSPLQGANGLAAMKLVPGAAELGEALHEAARPDLRVGSESPAALHSVGFIRRKLAGADIYFVANTSNQPVKATLGFATKFAHGERLNVDTGAVMSKAAPAETAVELAPYESAVFVFGDGAAGAPAAVAMVSKPIVDLSRDWKVAFPGIDKNVSEPTLTDWTASPATLHYSGEAVYTREFKLSQAPQGRIELAVTGGNAIAGGPQPQPQPVEDHQPNATVTRTGPGMRAWYDPPIREAALVFVNGQAAGALWHPPYRLDVTKLVQEGENRIEIRVYNTALNAWAAAPPRDYGSLDKAFGNRFQMQDLDQVKPLPSGILGGVELVQQEPE